MESVWHKEDSDSNKKGVTHSVMITSTNLMIVTNVKVSIHKATLAKCLLTSMRVLRMVIVIGRNDGFCRDVLICKTPTM